MGEALKMEVKRGCPVKEVKKREKEKEAKGTKKWRRMEGGQTNEKVSKKEKLYRRESGNGEGGEPQKQ